MKNTKQIVANIITLIVLVSLVAYIVLAFIYPNITLNPGADLSGGISKSLVAFTVTFIVLICVTGSIYALKLITERPPKPAKVQKKEEDDLLIAAITAAVQAFESEHPAAKKGFVVKEYKTPSQWGKLTKEEYENGAAI